MQDTGKQMMMEWKRAEASFLELVRYFGIYKRRKMISFFYARRMAGYRLPKYFVTAMRENDVSALERFQKEYDRNESCYMFALNHLVEKKGFQSLPEDITYHKVSSFLDNPAASTLVLDGATVVELGEEYTELLVKLGNHFCKPSRHEK